MYLKSRSVALSAILCVVFACAGCSTGPAKKPDVVNRLIDEILSEDVRNPPGSIWRYEYDGQEVYFVPQYCCDFFSMLYDSAGNVVCSPDGGIAGEGDGKCPDFFEKRTGEEHIWTDPRTDRRTG